MKRGAIFAILLLAGIGALAWSEWKKTHPPVGPGTLLNFVADAEREASRAPFLLTRLSDAEEIRIGDELAERSSAELSPSGANRDVARRIEAYLGEVGAQVARRAKRKLPYKFHYIAAPSFINAFALPGGHVFVGQGLLALVTTEDELAAVLGHEVEHIDLYHCAERVQVEAAARKIPLGGLITLPVAVFQAGYSKNQELEADREGTWLAVQTGYSPYGIIRLFAKLEQMRRTYVDKAGSPQQELSEVAIQILAGYFRSHPLPEERILQVRGQIAKHKWEDRKNERPLKVNVSHGDGNASR